MLLRITAITVIFASAVYAVPNLANIPMSFEPGARDSEFVAHAGQGTVILSASGAQTERGRMRLVSADARASAHPEDLVPAYTNYLTDADPAKWRTYVPNYRRVRYCNVYP